MEYKALESTLGITATVNATPRLYKITLTRANTTFQPFEEIPYLFQV